MSRVSFRAALFLLLGLMLGTANVAQARGEELVALVGATLFDGTGAPSVPDAVVVVAGDRIQSVGLRARVKIPRGARVVDVAGRFILPGLIDTHVHFFQSGGLYTRPDVVDLQTTRPYRDELAAIHAGLDDTFRRYLIHGVTSVVDVGGPMWNFEVRRRAESTPFAPRVAATGPLISTVARPQLDLGDPPIILAKSPEEGRALVRQQVSHHPAFIKIWFVLTPDRSMEEMVSVVGAIIDEAHRAKVRVAVHATELEAARAAVLAGADLLVHSVQDKIVDDAFVALLRDRKIPLTPTLVVLDGYRNVLAASDHKDPSELEAKYGSPEAIATWREWPKVNSDALRQVAEQRRQRVLAANGVTAMNLKRLASAGVIIAAGTDAGNIGTLPGASMLDELLAMERAGMGRREVLLAATRDAARVFAPEPKVGTIAPGMFADLLVVDGDPLSDLANLRRIRSVMRGGELHAPDEILPPNHRWVVDGQLDAYNRHDIERFVSFFAPDVEIFEFPGGERKMKGRDEMRRVYGKLFSEQTKLKCTILERTERGEFVIDHELISGRTDRPYFHAVAIYEVRGGLIQRVWFPPR